MPNESDKILTGWKEISSFMGRGERLLLRLVEEENLPITYIGGKPTTTKNLLLNWIKSRALKTCQIEN